MARTKNQPQGISLGLTPLAYLGVRPTTPPNIQEYNNSDPTIRDFFEFNIGDIWINAIPVSINPPVNNYRVWMLVDKLQQDATWIMLAGGSGQNVTSLQTDDGAIVPPNNSGIIVLGGGNGIVTSGNPATNTTTISVDGNVATSYPTDFLGPAIPALNELNIFGGASIDAEQVALVYRQNIHTSGAGNTVSVKLNDSISIPFTTSDGRAGVIYAGGATAGFRFMHNYGTANTFLGTSAGNFTLTTASAVSNTGLGLSTLSQLTTGSDNTAVGWATIGVATTGSFNTCTGAGGMAFVTTGSSNVGVGAQVFSDGLAAAGLTTGNHNIAIGRDAGGDYRGAESSNILIGSLLFGIVGESNTLRIGVATGAGDGELNRAFISGIRGITTGVADAIPVLIDSAGQLGTTSSSARFKMNIKDMAEDSSPLMKLRPVTFNYKEDATLTKQWGLIAEEVAEVLPELVVYDSNKEPYTVRYHDLPALLLNEIKKLSSRVEHLENKINTMLKG